MPNTKNEKHFPAWLKRKSTIHFSENTPNTKEGEVWWCAIGENVKVEINGKGEYFSRPVVVFKKLSRYGFLAIPLTSQPHYGSWYTHFEFQQKTQFAALSQIRMMSTSRLYNRMGKLSARDFRRLQEAFQKLLSN